MEIENAVNQAKKELATRFDFKGSKAEIVLEKTETTKTAKDIRNLIFMRRLCAEKEAQRQAKKRSRF